MQRMGARLQELLKDLQWVIVRGYTGGSSIQVDSLRHVERGLCERRCWVAARKGE